MTREEAIEVLKNNGEYDRYYIGEVKDKSQEAIGMAIKALEILEEFEKAQIITGSRLNGRTYAYKCGFEDGKRKALEQEPCGDCITRKAVLDINESHHGQMPNHINHQIWQEIKDLPPVTPKPKTDVLDKIRAEIEALEDGISSYHNDRPWIFKDEVLAIIDKYTA